MCSQGSQACSTYVALGSQALVTYTALTLESHVAQRSADTATILRSHEEQPQLAVMSLSSALQSQT